MIVTTGHVTAVVVQHVYLYADEGLYFTKVQTVQTVQMWQANRNSRKCYTVFLYSTVQTLHRKQTLEMYTTEQLYACIAVHKLIKAKYKLKKLQ